ncbi:MAG: hypothetical protein AB1Z55_12100 [Acidimicrobiia bacterium]
MLAVLALVVAACGGSDDAADAGQAEATSTTAAAADDPGGDDAGDEEAPASTAADDDDAPAAAPVDGVGTATVTIDGETYEFGDAGIASQCLSDLSGVFSVALYLVGDDGAPDLGAGSLSLFLVQEGSDIGDLDQRPEAVVTIGSTSESWVASEAKAEEFELEAGTSQVDAYEIDGTSASGTATFIEENSYFAFSGGSADEIRTATGEFEVTCSE